MSDFSLIDGAREATAVVSATIEGADTIGPTVCVHTTSGNIQLLRAGRDGG